MARKLRLEFAGACYHVTNRGNYRRDLFAAAGAAQSFHQCLDEACTRFGWLLHAYVIMRNHFHLAVETPEPNLSDGMKWLQGTWAQRFNRFRRETGRPFQGRYRAGHLEKGHALAQAAHYIHLNPVRAKIVSADRVGEYPWSSLAWLGRRRRPAWLNPATVLQESGGLADTPAGWRSYAAYLGVLFEEDAAFREEKHSRLLRGGRSVQPPIGRNYGQSSARQRTSSRVSNWSARTAAPPEKRGPNGGRIGSGSSRKP